MKGREELFSFKIPAPSGPGAKIGRPRPSTTATPRKFPLHSHSAFKPFARYSDRLLAEDSGAASALEEKVIDDKQLAKSNQDGRFQLQLDPLKAGESLRIRVVREEIVHIPGSYNLYTPEFTKGLRVLIAQCPSTVQAEVWVRPQGEGKHLVPTGNEWWTEA